MGCCANCFGDVFLEKVIGQKSSHEGDCDHCKSQGVKIVEPVELQEYFATLVGVYKRDDEGELLVDWFRDEWTLFCHETMDNSRAKELLAEILDDGEIVRKRFSVAAAETSGALESWKDFRDELLWQNRFFLEKTPDLVRLKELFDCLVVEGPEIDRIYYRARLHDRGQPFVAEKMGAPPREKAGPGRANPAGIPYLYLASDARTVVSEVRPSKGQFASVASFRIEKGSRILDLRNPKRTVSPFLFSDEQSIAILRGDISFLEVLGDELSRPVLENAAQVDYLPSQYLCEYAKYCGFDGVFYKSSVGPGFNLAYFKPDSPKVDEEVVEYSVTGVEVSIGREGC